MANAFKRPQRLHESFYMVLHVYRVLMGPCKAACLDGDDQEDRNALEAWLTEACSQTGRLRRQLDLWTQADCASLQTNPLQAGASKKAHEFRLRCIPADLRGMKSCTSVGVML